MSFRIATALSLIGATPLLAQGGDGAFGNGGIQGLSWLEGEWKGEESWERSHAFPDGATATSTHVVRHAVTGAFLEWDSTRLLGRQTIHGKAILGWDQESRSFRLFWFHSTGEIRIGTGQIVEIAGRREEHGVEFTGTGDREGIAWRARLTCEKRGADSLELTIEEETKPSGVEREFVAVMHSRLSRVASSGETPDAGIHVRDWAGEWEDLEKRADQAMNEFENGMRVYRDWKYSDPPDDVLRGESLETLERCLQSWDSIVREGAEVLRGNQDDLVERLGRSPDEAALETEPFDTQLVRWKMERLEVTRLVDDLSTRR